MIKIQSSKTIHVSSGLEYEDFTKANSDIPDRLKVMPTWQKKIVCITEGVGEYEDEVATWPCVKALERDGILTISGVETVQPIETKKRGKASLAEVAKEE